MPHCCTVTYFRVRFPVILNYTAKCCLGGMLGTWSLLCWVFAHTSEGPPLILQRFRCKHALKWVLSPMIFLPLLRDPLLLFFAIFLSDYLPHFLLFFPSTSQESKGEDPRFTPDRVDWPFPGTEVLLRQGRPHSHHCNSSVPVESPPMLPHAQEPYSSHFQANPSPSGLDQAYSLKPAGKLSCLL